MYASSFVLEGKFVLTSWGLFVTQRAQCLLTFICLFCFFCSCEKDIGILIGIAFDLLYHFGFTGHLNNINLPNS